MGGASDGGGLRRLAVVWAVAGGVAGAAVGGVGFGDGGVSVPAAVVGLAAGALGCGGLAWAAAASVLRSVRAGRRGDAEPGAAADRGRI